MKCREDGFVPYRAVAPDNARTNELELVSFHQRREFVKTGHRRAGTCNDIKISHSKARLNGVDVNGLQELCLEQFADTSDFMPLDIEVSIRKKAVRGMITWIKTQGFSGFHKRALLEAQIAVDTGQTRTARRLVPIQQQF